MLNTKIVAKNATNCVY